MLDPGVVALDWIVLDAILSEWVPQFRGSTDVKKSLEEYQDPKACSQPMAEFCEKLLAVSQTGDLWLVKRSIAQEHHSTSLLHAVFKQIAHAMRCMLS